MTAHDDIGQKIAHELADIGDLDFRGATDRLLNWSDALPLCENEEATLRIAKIIAACASRRKFWLDQAARGFPEG